MLYLMGSIVQHDERREFFEQELLQSSAFSYHAKKQLVLKIVNRGEILVGKNKTNLEQKLKKIEEWRNAFAHGTLECDNKDGFSIKYYSGDQKEKVLSDDFWTEVEKDFQECSDLLKEVQNELGEH